MNDFSANSNEMLASNGNFSDNKSPSHVLLIEDNPGDARLVEILLEDSDLVDCKITHHSTLSAGESELEKDNQFAAVLLDLTLPDSRGFDTLERLISRFPNLNIIVLTGHSDKALGLEAVKYGAQDFLVKGAFDSDLLAKTLRYSIQRNSVTKRLEETQRLAQIGNWELSLDKDSFTASDETFRIFGLKPRYDRVKMEDLMDLSHPFHLFYVLHNEVASSGVEVAKDVQISTTDGDAKYVHILCSPKVVGSNSVTSHGIIQDITERKIAQQEISKSQERYRDIFNKSKDAIFICTLDGKLIDFNDSTTTLFGMTKEQLEEKGNFHNLYLSNDKTVELLSLLRSQKAVKDFELDIIHKNKEIRHGIMTANLLVNDEFIGYNAIIRDTTEIKQAEKIRKARDMAEQSAKMKERFIASISHEMRTPMNAILGMSNILQLTELNGEQSELIDSIKQSSEILLGIVNDILEISTIQNGKIVFKNQSFDLNSILDNLINVMHYKAEEKEIHLELKVDPDIPHHLVGDQLRLSQILFNLVGNAVKFTDKGRIFLSVKSLNTNSDNVQLQFSVEDTGIGIPKDKLDAIFETFTRIRQKDRLFEGTGLGLSIAKNLVEQQGGKIYATSKVGVGSKFIFDLILEIDSHNSTKTDDVRIDPPVDDNAIIKILLAEDNKLNQLVAKKTLVRKFPNLELTIVENGKLAIGTLQENDFDLILMDIQMPIMDGYEASVFTRNHIKRHKSTPILAMTAHAHIAIDQQYLNYGMDDYVLKPFKPEELFFKIKKYYLESKQ